MILNNIPFLLLKTLLKTRKKTDYLFFFWIAFLSFIIFFGTILFKILKINKICVFVLGLC